MKSRGFALPEMFIVLLIVAVLIGVLIVVINPSEQLRKSRDTARATLATELFRAFERFYVREGRMPQISPAVSSADCPVIVKSQPVSNLSDLRDELSSWFPERILKPENSLYAGFVPDKNQIKICHKIEAKANAQLTQTSGCSLGSEVFACVSE